MMDLSIISPYKPDKPHHLLDLEFGMDGNETNDFEGEAEYEFVAGNGQNDSNLEEWITGNDSPIKSSKSENENNGNNVKSDNNYSNQTVQSAKDFRVAFLGKPFEMTLSRASSSAAVVTKVTLNNICIYMYMYI
jgi:hypothetical protein